MLEECAPQGGPELQAQGAGRTAPRWAWGPPDGPGSVRPKEGSGPVSKGPTTPPSPHHQPNESPLITCRYLLRRAARSGPERAPGPRWQRQRRQGRVGCPPQGGRVP